MSCLPSEGQAALTGSVGKGRNATVVLVAGAVEDHALDASSLGACSDQLADLLGLLGLVAGRGADVGLHRGGERQRLADLVVDDLDRDVLRRPGHDQARTLVRTRDLLATALLTAQPRGCPVRSVLVVLQRDR